MTAARDKPAQKVRPVGTSHRPEAIGEKIRRYVAPRPSLGNVFDKRPVFLGEDVHLVVAEPL